ncbi:MAG: hypothetical protein HY922_04150 [Elusimicrobia bacterium]|nr:hypothetical protein [Elusimicrobiota bacterium]
MRNRLAAAAVLALCLCGSPPASAGVILKEMRWQVAPNLRSPKPTWHDAAAWLQPPGSKIERAPRVLAVLLNESAKPEEAILLRYAFSARLAQVQGGGASEGTWTIPFLLDERRVPKIRGNDSIQVTICLNRAVFRDYLLRMRRAGFWPDSLRLQVMVEPRPGESSFDNRVIEATLPVLWKQPAAQPAPAGPPEGKPK